MQQIEFDYGHCASSEWDDGALLIQPDALGPGGANGGSETLQPLGLYARPDDPTDEGRAGLLIGRQGNHSFGMPLTDTRGIGTVPNGPKGSTTLYAASNSVTQYIHLDGGTDGKSYGQWLLKYGDKSLSIIVDCRTAGQENISIRHGEGHGITFTGDKKVVINSSNGSVWIELNDTKIVLNGDVQVNGGLMLGGPAGTPVALASELQQVVSVLSALLTAGLTVNGLTATGVFFVPTPGSSKVSAAT